MKYLLLIFILFSAFVYAETPKEITPKETKQESSETSYLACGCGCCGGAEPIKQCLYHANGDDLNKIIQEDKKNAQSQQCQYAGCSVGILYYYCD